MQAILLLGGSADQIFAIRTARQMGIYSVVVDGNPKSPGFAAADYHAVVSTRDINALKKFIDDYHRSGDRPPLAGVFVMGSDIPFVVAELSAHLGTSGVSKETARVATDKYLMKCRFKECGVPIPWFSLLSSADDLEAPLREHCRLVIKPVDRSGARGVFLINRDSDYRRLFNESLKLSFSAQVLAEAYIPGLQISTETVMYKGVAYTPGFADRNYEMLEAYAPNIIENGGWVPSSVVPEVRTQVEALVEKAALALGITDGIAKGDIVVGPSGPTMIEMAARPSGGDFSESLIPIGSGVNLIEAGINIAIGCAPDLQKLQPQWRRGVVNRYFFPAPGVLRDIQGIDEVRAQPWLRKLEFWYQPGEVVPVVRSHADRFGVFIAEGSDRAEAEARAAWIYKTIQIITD